MTPDTYTFSRTIPLAMVAPPSTLALIEEMLCPFLYFYILFRRDTQDYLIGPTLLTTDHTKFTSSTNTTRFTIFNVRNWLHKAIAKLNHSQLQKDLFNTYPLPILD